MKKISAGGGVILSIETDTHVEVEIRAFMTMWCLHGHYDHDQVGHSQFKAKFFEIEAEIEKRKISLLAHGIPTNGHVPGDFCIEVSIDVTITQFETWDVFLSEMRVWRPWDDQSHEEKAEVALTGVEEEAIASNEEKSMPGDQPAEEAQTLVPVARRSTLH